MPTIRIASYNLRSLRDDAAAAAAVVRAIDPDVLLLQEVPRYPLSSYRIADFARRCELMWSGRTRLTSGTGLMTSIRVQASDSVDRSLPVQGRLPWTTSGDPRSYTVAQVAVPGGTPFTAVSIHLSLDADERLAHVRQVLSELDVDPDEEPAAAPAEGAAGIPAMVVGGDLNETLEGAAWSVLGRRLSLASADARTFPSRAPRTRIDAIFATSGLNARPGGAVDLDPAMLAAATDHLPVWIDLDV